MAIFRIRSGGPGAPLSQARAEGQEVLPAVHGVHGMWQGQSAREYEAPVVTVIGSVRDLTAGSAASGNKDANSQYYW
jgi:hypothetical protein